MVILRAALGIVAFLAIAWLMSEAKRLIQVRVIVTGLLMQVGFAWLILRTDAGRSALDGVADGIMAFLAFSNEGARFVFGDLVDTTFAFGGLVTIIYFSAVMAILYHLGIMQVVVWLLAKGMTVLMRVSGAESFAMAANIFVGQTEAPLVIRPYVAKMTRSEMMALMAGGFANIAGSVFAIYVGFLGKEYAGHLLAASFMSAPAAFMIAKLMVPETQEPETGGRVELRIEREAHNVMEAVAIGTSDGLKLWLNVIAMLIAFTGLVHLLNWPLSGIEAGGEALSIQRILGWVFSPIAWLLGIPWGESQAVGTLLGTKITFNEFIAYKDMGVLQASSAALPPRTAFIASYALCGFANFASIGIQMGGIIPLAPDRRTEISQLAFRAMIAGALASCMTGAIAGVFIDV